MEKYGMPRLMIGRYSAILFGNNLALLFRSDSYLHKGVLDVLLNNKSSVTFC